MPCGLQTHGEAAKVILLVVGVIDLQTSYITGGIGILPFYAWLVALIVLAFGPGVLPATVGWLAGAVIVMTVVVGAVAVVTMGPPLWIASLALAVVICAWLLALGANLSGHVIG